MPSLDSTEMEGWDEVEKGVTIDVCESESSEESEFEDVAERIQICKTQSALPNPASLASTLGSGGLEG